MILTVEQCLQQAETLQDSLELSEELKSMCELSELSPGKNYFLTEAACNLEAHHRLLISLLTHLSKENP